MSPQLSRSYRSHLALGTCSPTTFVHVERHSLKMFEQQPGRRRCRPSRRQRRLGRDLAEAFAKLRIGWIVQEEGAAVVLGNLLDPLLSVRAGAVDRATVL